MAISLKPLIHSLLCLASLLAGMPILAAEAPAKPAAPAPVLAELADAANGWRLQVRTDGTIQSLDLKAGGTWEGYPFRADKRSGPAWAGVTMRLADEKSLRFEGAKDGVRYSLQYKNEAGRLAIVAGLENTGAQAFVPEAARLILGINCEMIKYPDWRTRFFPTLLRAEKTHFWGYFMTPNSRILAIGSPDPVASWQYDYNGNGTHRIFTVSLDVLHALPLPERHPQDLTRLKPGEKRQWTFFLQPVPALDQVKPMLAKTLGAPFLELDRHTVAAGETARFSVFSGSDCQAQMTTPAGKSSKIPMGPRQNDLQTFAYTPADGPGVYTLEVADAHGKRSEARLYQRQPWSWYLRQARSEGLRIPPCDTHHAESFYSFYTYLLARHYLPNPAEDAQAETNTQKVLAKLFDPKLRLMAIPTDCKCGRGRIQDSATMAAYFANRHAITGDRNDLENAAGLADFLLGTQKADGAYYASNGRGHYTSVAYLAKSIMEVATEEARLKEEPLWRERAERHASSAKAAMEELSTHLDNINTEGEMTFEDGMVSCSALQLAMQALRETDPAARQRFQTAAVELDRLHRCLTQLVVPDCRMNGGTLRFWETVYAVNLMHNMMNSPTGWTAWNDYSLTYLYLLTGDEAYLRTAMDSLGACMQLIDLKTGRLSFCFTQDPFIRTEQWLEDPAHPGIPQKRPVLVGEQYVGMVSDWLHRPNKSWRPIWGIDNQVHEVFKCMGEVALANAYVVERANGELVGYNCSVVQANGIVTITPAEALVSRIHLNLRQPRQVQAIFGKGPPVAGTFQGMTWIGPGGIPENLRPVPIPVITSKESVR